MESRRAEVVLEYEGVDISRDIAPFLVGFVYTDNAHGRDDELSVTLEDREGRWRDPWYPEKGAAVRATILVRNWTGDGEVLSLPCGLFRISSVECSGPPTVVELKCVSTSVKASAKQERKTKAWENIALSGIAGELTARHGLTLRWDSAHDPLYQRKDQVERSDLLFLKTLCEDAGLALKVTDEQVVIFDEKSYEKKTPGTTLTFGDDRIRTYRFLSKMAGIYKGARVKYHHPVQDETFDVYEGDDEESENGEVLQINEAVESLAEAKTLAEKKLHESNKKETTGTVELMGELSFVGGTTIGIRGFGAFDGTYFIESATHSVSRSGYTTSLELRRRAKEGKKTAAKKKTKPPKVVDSGFEVYS